LFAVDLSNKRLKNLCDARIQLGGALEVLTVIGLCKLHCFSLTNPAFIKITHVVAHQHKTNGAVSVLVN
jgi:hypothetical protein